MTRVHLDTDIGGDIDDLCALAMLLKWPGIELMAVTSVTDNDGKRAGMARYALDLAGRDDVPVAAGADASLDRYRVYCGLPNELDYWPEIVPPLPGPVDDALDLLEKSIDHGALILAIGAYTNLALLEERSPGILRRAKLWLMGGYVHPPRPGYPQWGRDFDWNIQVDVRSAQHVLAASHPTLVPLSITVETALRRAYLPALRVAGPMGALLARQAEAHGREHDNETVHGRTCARLPDDILNFQHDPLACAIALGWRDGVVIEDLPLRTTVEDGYLVQRVDPAGRPARVVTAVNGDAFNEFWLRVVTGR